MISGNIGLAVANGKQRNRRPALNKRAGPKDYTAASVFFDVITER